MNEDIKHKVRSILKDLFDSGKAGTQAEAAEKIGCDQSYLSLILIGKRAPSNAFIKKMCFAYNIDRTKIYEPRDFDPEIKALKKKVEQLTLWVRKLQSDIKKLKK